MSDSRGAAKCALMGFFLRGTHMKIAALITVAALTCGTALAQGYGNTADRDSSASRNQSAAVANDSQPKGEGIMDKTKRAFHRLGDKIRSVGNKSKDHTDKTAQQNDTRTMGAAGADKSDSARQARIDQAYANSQKSKSMDK